MRDARCATPELFEGHSFCQTLIPVSANTVAEWQLGELLNHRNPREAGCVASYRPGCARLSAARLRGHGHDPVERNTRNGFAALARVGLS